MIKTKIKSPTFSDERLAKCRGYKLTKEDIKKKEDEMDNFDLEMQFEYNNLKIKKMGDLRKLVSTFENTKQIEEIEDLIEDSDYYYIFNWYLKNYVF
jgi:hypothetical protein